MENCTELVSYRMCFKGLHCGLVCFADVLHGPALATSSADVSKFPFYVFVYSDHSNTLTLVHMYLMGCQITQCKHWQNNIGVQILGKTHFSLQSWQFAKGPVTQQYLTYPNR